MPRLCEHTGFGLRDLRRVLSGPAYARRWVERAGRRRRGHPDPFHGDSVGEARAGPQVTGPDGLLEVDARAVVLATGARERPRAARLVPGTRPSGIFTTGQLQQWVHRQHLPLCGRALIVGAEHVSYSAVLTLRDSGRPPGRPGDRPPAHADVPLLRPRDPRRPPRAGMDRDIRDRRAPDATAWTGSLVRGPDGIERTVAVDVVVFTGDFIPDNELARLAHLSMDPGTRVPPATSTARRARPGSSPPATSSTRPRRRTWRRSAPRRSVAPPPRGCAPGDRSPPRPATVRLRRRRPPALGRPEPGRARPRRDRARARQDPGLSGPPAARRDPGWPAPRFVPPPSHDPEPVARRAVGLVAARAAGRGRAALGVVTRAGGREKRHPGEVPLARKITTGQAGRRL